MFGEKLKELRNIHQLTQVDLASILKVTRPAITKYERNERNPDAETLIKIANYFNVSTDYLLGRVASPKEKLAYRIINELDSLDILGDDANLNEELVSSTIQIFKNTYFEIQKLHKNKSHE